VTKRTEASGKRRCRGTSKRGDPCRATVVGVSGYCAVHDPERPIDMRELGRKGGKGRRRGVAEQLPAAERASLRERLRDQLDHGVVQTAIERALAGGNESARVAAVKFLADLELYRKDADEEDRARAVAKAAADARQYLATALARLAVSHEQREVRDLLEELAAKLEAEAVSIHPDLRVGDVSPEQAERTLEQLTEAGLLVPRHKVEQLAQERLKVLKEEHGIPA
jgi:DNA-binding transcriptional ArsR family regulator